ncbi:aminoacetone oxidase family FAD-binding enzyme [Allocoprobacillus halotolerans]|uniref:Aminoacetone oxidase family FAD-binding enzyme n=1 Tax=Allocoprobacillus halotolerans TaxID=2944914 RepID=A0ABY5I3E2_9FIRM|nr:aminoacetone oxidase family FAD-binding enzyme [Allocoprobacillus halotolerans]UTY38909.1 aminoacetone oxidase family FAD-binding enzyme [Allocoprobacillus halotolerans]
MKKIVIIGAGASGVYLSILLKQKNPCYEVIVLEQNKAPLKKLLATGNGRCNLSNQKMNSKYYQSDNQELVQSIIQDFDMVQQMQKIGLYCTYQGDLLYPKSEQALTVKNVFMQRSEEKGVIFAYDQEVTQIQKHKHQYLITTTSQQILADAIVLAMGSEAGKLSGMNHSRYDLLKQLQLKIIEPMPSLVQFYTSPAIKSLKGVRVKGTFSLIENQQCIHKEKGELLFTDYGVSGIAVMQLSSFYKKHHNYQLYIDFFDEISHNQLCQLLSNQTSLFLEGLINHKLAVYFQKYQHLSIEKLASLLKHYPLNIQGVREASYAQVMKGGLSLDNVTEDLELKQYPHIYAIGEILNVAGMCGGYNLHFALASACHVVEAIEREKYVKNS